MHHRELGRIGEDLAARYLTARGWLIVERNVRTRGGELDIVAAREGIVAFVEVKTRRSRGFGTPAEAVTPVKAARIRRLATAYLADRPVRAREIRFDVIDIRASGEAFAVSHLEGAF